SAGGSCCGIRSLSMSLIRGIVQTRPGEDGPRHLARRLVDHLAVESRGGAVRRDDAARALDLLRGRGVDLVADRDLRRVDAPLAVVAEQERAACRRTQPCLVAERDVRA